MSNKQLRKTARKLILEEVGSPISRALYRAGAFRITIVDVVELDNNIISAIWKPKVALWHPVVWAIILVVAPIIAMLSPDENVQSVWRSLIFPDDFINRFSLLQSGEDIKTEKT